MNAQTIAPIWTPFNQRPSRTERRVLRNGRWVKANAKSDTVLRWLKGQGESK